MIENLALAIQKPDGKPNMGDESIALLKAGGLMFSFKSRVDDTPVRNIPGLDIVKMKNGDLVKAVCEGDVDLAIAGLDMYQEYAGQPKAIILDALGFSRCALKLVIIKGKVGFFDYKDPTSLAGLRIATSYVNVTEDYFSRIWNTKVSIRPYLGGEEGVVKRGKAEACVIISQSGDSLEANRLKSVGVVLESQAVLLANSELSEKRGSEKILWRTLRAITTGRWRTQYTMLEANFLQSLTDEVLARLPSAGSPTVSFLQSGGQAVRCLVPVNALQEALNKYYDAGASEVVRLSVESVYPNLDNPEITKMMRAIYGEDWEIPNPPYSV
ncbi:ATP phosphoribosyltransferase [Candidatus Daviesbacteria bacterium]|nr:ATP phosphoribosyltransferase [Candidatus Daviesbacteria bacterium]